MSEQLTITLAAALLPIFLTTALTWVQGRARENRRIRRIDAAQKQLQFLNDYLALQTLAATPERLGTIRQSVMAEVEALRADLNDDIREIETERAKGQGRNMFRRYLLFYRLRGLLANMFRVLFYLLLLLSVFMSSIVSSMQVDSVWVRITGALVFALPLALLTILFRWLAVASDQRTDQRTEATNLPV